MPDRSLQFDAASALIQGSRETQEDAIASDFTIGSDCGLVVLADGMGGHCAGELASNIVVTEIFSELKLHHSALVAEQADVAGFLRNAASSANECLRRHSEINPDTKSMGTTLVALVQMSNSLHWISIGDSLLLLFRAGEMQRLNEDHSLAPQIDLMVKKGEMSQEVGDRHPQRNCLTSALTGDPIPDIDCPETPFMLAAGDVVIAASDGLQFLSDSAIRDILTRNLNKPSTEIAKALVDAITELDDPDQDNFCCSVIKAIDPSLSKRKARARRTSVSRGGVDAARTGAPGKMPPVVSTPQTPIFDRLRRLTGSLFW